MQQLIKTFWFNFDLNQIYETNYSDQILKSIVKTTYAKKKLSILLLMLLTMIVRLHIDAILAIVINTPYFFINFLIQIVISVFLVMKTGWIYQAVERFDREVYSLTRYLVNNYSEDNYRKWKRIMTFIICLYLIIYLLVVEITSKLLIMYIIQYLICFIILETIEKKYYDQFLSIFKKHPPSKRVSLFTYDDDDFEIIQTNIQSDNTDLKKTDDPGAQIDSDPHVKKNTENKLHSESHPNFNRSSEQPSEIMANNAFILNDDFRLKTKK
jgi:hypothetical protein